MSDSSASLPPTGVTVDPATVIDRCHGALLGALVGEQAGLAGRGADVEITASVVHQQPGPLVALLLAQIRDHLNGTPMVPSSSPDAWVAASVHGLWTPCEPLEPLAEVAASEVACEHPSTVVTAAAGALAVLLSASIRGVIDRAVLPMAMGGADAGRAAGTYRCGPDVSSRLRWASALVSGAESSMVPDLVELLIGTSRAPQEVLPAALVLSSVDSAHPWEACRMAAERGGDAHVLACVTGLLAGARAGASAFPHEVVDAAADLHELAREAAAHRSAPERPKLPTLAEVKAGRG